MNVYTLENFLNYCEDMQIANEAINMHTGEGGKLHPVFVVLLYSDSNFDHFVEKFVKEEQYWHAAIGFGPALSKLYSFNFGECKANKYVGGLSYESFNFYKNEHPTGTMNVSCVLLDDYSYSKIQKTLQYYIINKKKTKYSFINLLWALIGHKRPDKLNMSLVCSTFVDTLLKSADVRLNNKRTNLVKPDDLLSGKDKQLHVYAGRIINYDIHKATKTVEKFVDDESKSYFAKHPRHDKSTE